MVNKVTKSTSDKMTKIPPSSPMGDSYNDEQDSIDDCLLDEVGSDFRVQANGEPVNLTNNKSKSFNLTNITNINRNGSSSPENIWNLEDPDVSIVDTVQGFTRRDEYGNIEEIVLDHEPSNSDIEFNVDDTELDQLETKENEEDNAPTEMETKPEPSTTAAVTTAKIDSGKKKRKFGLEYIVVSISDLIMGSAMPSMKESPHECVLCLPGHTFNAAMLAKHINSVQHLANVLELHNHELHQLHKSSQDAAQLNTVLRQAIPEPTEPVKLMVVAKSKLQEMRDSLKKTVEERRSRGRKGIPDGQLKRTLTTDAAADEDSSFKRRRTSDAQAAEQSKKIGLMVGDERAKQLCHACPELEESCTLAWYPQGRLEKILAGALMRLNSSYKVLIVVALLNDFIIEKPEQKTLYLLSPDIEAIGETLRNFANKVKSINPAIKIIMTVPAYVDFIGYSKRLKHLTPQDFARLERYSSQILEAFQTLHEGIRFLSRNTMCFNFNISLRDPSKRPISKTGRLPNAATQMQFIPGTLVDGYRLSDVAAKCVAADINKRLCASAAKIPDLDAGIPKKLIECWADCQNIIMVGDHQTFKFESTAPLDMIKNVTLVTEKFSPMKQLLEKCDSLLNESVDLLVIVGFYREFAQNVINGRYTILEPKMPNKNETFTLLHKYKKKWTTRFPRLTIIFTIPQVVDFFKYNTLNNPDIQKSESFTNDMNKFSHQFSVNIMSFYKELRPSLTIGSRRIWLYHMTNSLYQQYPKLLTTMGNFNVDPQFPPNSTFDGFKPNQSTSLRMRAELVAYVTKLFRKNPVDKHDVEM